MPEIPIWLAFIVVAVGLIAWMTFVDSFSSDLFERWRKRKKREKELKRGKK